MGGYPSVLSLASSPSMSTVMVPKKLTLSWWVGHRLGQHLVLGQLATGAHFGDGAAVVLADPGDDRVGGDSQAPCLLGLLLGCELPNCLASSDHTVWHCQLVTQAADTPL